MLRHWLIRFCLHYCSGNQHFTAQKDEFLTDQDIKKLKFVTRELYGIDDKLDQDAIYDKLERLDEEKIDLGALEK